MMGDTRLKMSDSLLQQKCETIMHQFGWDITRRSVSEDSEMPPLLTYKLENGTNHSELVQSLTRVGYGPADEPTLTIKGKKSSLQITLRQLKPTDVRRNGGLKTFGDGGDE